MADRYGSFLELAEHEREGIDYQIRSHRRPSKIAVIAPHGGKIEPGTSEIAEAISGEHFSFYAFEGIRKSRNADLKLAGDHFDEPECLALKQDSTVVLRVDGSSESGKNVSIAGDDQRLRESLKHALDHAGFVTSEVETGQPRLEIPRRLRDELQDGTEQLERFVSAVQSALTAYEEGTVATDQISLFEGPAD